MDWISVRALSRLIKERTNQVGHGFTSEHDDEHDRGQLALHAALYATPTSLWKPIGGASEANDPWQWDEDWDKRGPKVWGPSPSDPEKYVDSRLRDLEKAGGLILAEIERILRIKEARVSIEDA